MHLKQLSGVLAVHAILVTCACAEDVRDRAMDMQRKAIESRQRIKNGELRLEIQVWTKGFAKAKTTNRHFIFDGRDVRCDYGTGAAVASKTVLIGDEFIKYSPAFTLGDGKPKAIEMGGPDTLKAPLLGMFHPLVIGMVSSGPGHWYKYSDDSLLGQGIDSTEKVYLTDDNGEVLIRRSWSDTNKVLSVRIVPAKDFFVSAIEIESDHGKSRLVSSTVSTPTKYDGFWFPYKSA